MNLKDVSLKRLTKFLVFMWDTIKKRLYKSRLKKGHPGDCTEAKDSIKEYDGDFMSRS